MAIREILKYPEVKKITLVELDPVMIELAQNNPFFTQLNLNSLKDARVKIIRNNSLRSAGTEDLYVKNQNTPFTSHAGKVAKLQIVNIDAAKFLEQIPGKYDVIIADFPDPNSLELAKLYSQQFYQLINSKLTPYGIYVQQSSSPVHAKEAFLCIGRTLESAGLVAVPMHDNVPSFGEWGWWLAARTKYFSKVKLFAKLKKIQRLPPQVRYLTPELLGASLAFGRNQLYSKEKDINTLSTTRVYDYYLQAWRESL